MTEMGQNAEFLEAFMAYYVTKQAEGWNYQKAIKEFVKTRNGSEKSTVNEQHDRPAINDSKSQDMLENDASYNNSLDQNGDLNIPSSPSDCAEYITIESTSSDPEDVKDASENCEIIPATSVENETTASPFISVGKVFKMAKDDDTVEIPADDFSEQPETKTKIDNEDNQSATTSSVNSDIVSCDKMLIVKVRRISQRKIDKYTQKQKKSKATKRNPLLSNSCTSYEKLKMKAKSISKNIVGNHQPIEGKSQKSTLDQIYDTNKKCRFEASINDSNFIESNPLKVKRSEVTPSQSSDEKLPVRLMKRIPKKSQEQNKSSVTEWVQIEDLLPKLSYQKKATYDVAKGFVKYVKKPPLSREEECSFELGHFLRCLKTKIKEGLDITSPPGGHKAYERKIRQSEENHKKRLKRLRFEHKDRQRLKPYDRNLVNSNQEAIGKRRSENLESRKRLRSLEDGYDPNKADIKKLRLEEHKIIKSSSCSSDKSSRYEKRNEYKPRRVDPARNSNFGDDSYNRPHREEPKYSRDLRYESKDNERITHLHNDKLSSTPRYHKQHEFVRKEESISRRSSHSSVRRSSPFNDDRNKKSKYADGKRKVYNSSNDLRHSHSKIDSRDYHDRRTREKSYDYGGTKPDAQLNEIKKDYKHNNSPTTIRLKSDIDYSSGRTKEYEHRNKMHRPEGKERSENHRREKQPRDPRSRDRSSSRTSIIMEKQKCDKDSTYSPELKGPYTPEITQHKSSLTDNAVLKPSNETSVEKLTENQCQDNSFILTDQVARRSSHEKDILSHSSHKHEYRYSYMTSNDTQQISLNYVKASSSILSSVEMARLDNRRVSSVLTNKTIDLPLSPEEWLEKRLAKENL